MGGLIENLIFPGVLGFFERWTPFIGQKLSGDMSNLLRYISIQRKKSKMAKRTPRNHTPACKAKLAVP